MPHLSLALLGAFQITLDDEPITDRFESDKVRALLAYLAVESERPHRRDHLAGLLWPESPQRAARSNLRQALSNLRSAIDDRAVDPPFLRISRNELQINTGSNYWLDVAELQKQLAVFEPQTDSPAPDARHLQQIHRLQQAVELYQGDFLAHFTLPDAPAFEEWAAVQREALHVVVLDAFHALTAHHISQRQYEQARGYALRQVALEPWREEAHRQLMQLYALNGQPAAALAQFERCCRILADELGLDPMPETVDLYEQIRNGLIRPQAGASEPAWTVRSPEARQVHNAPSHATPCIGREQERRQIAHHLRESDCRLLTLIGPGGIGKTRLALQAADDLLDAFPQGIYFVPLAPLDSGDQLLTALADALHFSFSEGDDPQIQLMGYLQTQALLLVLDSFEHLLDAAPFLSTLLDGTTQLKVLVTSRERLNLREEWVLAVGGLCFPETSAFEAQRAPRTSGYSAVELFVQSARRNDPTFELRAADEPHVAAICRLVAGMPLAVELAATWVRTLSCREIHRELARDLDFLSSPLRDLPARHRSLRAVFDHSWRLLSPRMQRIYSRLAIFRGGFDREAAAAVADANLETLLTLVDKSLLRRNSFGRYEMHDLLRQYAARRLTSLPDHAETCAAHSRYYTRFIAERASDLQAGNAEAVDAISQEMGNLQAGWRYALEHLDRATVEQYVEHLGRFFDSQNQHREAITLYTHGLAHDDRGAGDGEVSLRRARWRRLLGEAYFRMGRIAESQSHLLQTLAQVDRPLPGAAWQWIPAVAGELVRQVGHSLWSRSPAPPADAAICWLEAAQVHERLGQIFFFANRSLPAIYTALRGLNLAERSGPSPVLARLYANTCLAAGMVPLHRLARRYARLARRTAHRLDDAATLAWVLEVISIYLVGTGAWDEAHDASIQARSIAEQLGDRRRWEECSVLLASSTHYQGDFARAIEMWRQIHASAFRRGDRQVQAWGLAGQAESHLAQGEAGAAIPLLQQALALHGDNGDQEALISAYGVLGLAYLHDGQHEQALQATQRAADLIAQSAPTAFTTLEGYSAVAEVYLRLWQAQAESGEERSLRQSEYAHAADRACRSMCSLARVFPIARPRALIWQGLCDWLAGRRRRAYRAWQQSAAAALRLSMPYEEETAHSYLERYPPSGQPLSGTQLNAKAQ